MCEYVNGLNLIMLDCLEREMETEPVENSIQISDWLTDDQIWAVLSVHLSHTDTS